MFSSFLLSMFEVPHQEPSPHPACYNQSNNNNDGNNNPSNSSTRKSPNNHSYKWRQRGPLFTIYSSLWDNFPICMRETTFWTIYRHNHTTKRQSATSDWSDWHLPDGETEATNLISSPVLVIHWIVVWPAENWLHTTVILPPLTVTPVTLSQVTIGLGNSMPGILLITVTEVGVLQSINGHGSGPRSAVDKETENANLALVLYIVW